MKKVRILIAIAAAIALGIIAYRIGMRDIAAQVANLRLVLPIVLLSGLVRLLLQTRAWKIGLQAEGIDLPQSRLLAVRLASQAAGYLAAVGPVVSEPAKLVLLRNHVGMGAAASATFFETGTYWSTSAILGLVGTCAAAFLISNDTAVCAAAGVFGVALVLLIGRRSLLSPVVRLFGSRAPNWLRSAESAELRIRSFRDRQPRAARGILALDSIAQLVTLAEVGSVLWGVGMQPSVLEVLTVEAAGRMVKVLGAWIPGRIGADEGGAAASFALLGFPAAAGLILALARRVRDLIWCGVGIVWAATSNTDQPRVSPVVSEVSICVEER
ncbi:MAG: lysylphosphatidylglycerol synthase domain-containing protein [Acidobacteriota bacterium]